MIDIIFNMQNRVLITFVVCVVSSVFTFSQTNADIVGQWYNAEKDAVITLFEEGETVSGKITWMESPNDEDGNPKTDPLNPDENLRSRARVGMVIMSSFSHIAGKVWDNGSLYDPEKGKTYNGIMTLENANTLDLRQYTGFSFIGRSSIWTRNLDEDSYVGTSIIENENLLDQLRGDLMEIIQKIEDVSLQPAKEIIEKIEKENLLILLKEDLKEIVNKLEKSER
jgi:uncharacterized protein (DUF2147 family)